MDRDDDEYDATVPVDACAAKRRLATKRLVAIDDIMMVMIYLLSLLLTTSHKLLQRSRSCLRHLFNVNVTSALVAVIKEKIAMRLLRFPFVF